MRRVILDREGVCKTILENKFSYLLSFSQKIGSTVLCGTLISQCSCMEYTNLEHDADFKMYFYLSDKMPPKSVKFD